MRPWAGRAAWPQHATRGCRLRRHAHGGGHSWARAPPVALPSVLRLPTHRAARLPAPFSPAPAHTSPTRRGAPSSRRYRAVPKACKCLGAPRRGTRHARPGAAGHAVPAQGALPAAAAEPKAAHGRIAQRRKTPRGVPPPWCPRHRGVCPPRDTLSYAALLRSSPGHSVKCDDSMFSRTVRPCAPGTGGPRSPSTRGWQLTVH